jgi:catechol 2,3-dioxygenase-like lactoylglutathione lyase family enzyme
MAIGLTQIKHVKLPVTDLRSSASWYCTLFDLELATEYAEQGEVRGVSLLDREGGIEIALRQREHCPGAPQLAGFDVFALLSPTKELLTTMAQRCDRLGIPHTEVWDFPGFGAGFDIPDPDGIHVRIAWHDPHGGYSSGFVGFDSDADGHPQTYDEPRLDLPVRPG